MSWLDLKVDVLCADISTCSLMVVVDDKQKVGAFIFLLRIIAYLPPLGALEMLLLILPIAASLIFVLSSLRSFMLLVNDNFFK